MNFKAIVGRILAVAVLLTSLGGCAGINLFAGSDGPKAKVVQRSEYCGTVAPDAELHFFASPGAFGTWIQDRDIRDLRTAAASLGGVLVLEMGQRPSAGYALDVNQAAQIEGDTLKISATWQGPELDAQVAQVITSPCAVIPRPQGDYSRVVVIDQLGNQRGEVTLP